MKFLRKSALLLSVLFIASCTGSDRDDEQSSAMRLPEGTEVRSPLLAAPVRPELSEQMKLAEQINGQMPRLAVASSPPKAKVPVAPIEPEACSPAKRAADPCDGMDNDHDGILDPCCCQCVAGAKVGDVNSDGMVTTYDGSCVFMVQFQKTVLRDSVKSCFDIDGNQVVEMNDVIALGTLMQNSTANQ